ncbi:MAG: 16S rRNA (uracil(1498)-N(3))-methyltransferase [Legionellaceae bacterium]|nr:16S rRNA (uracil(1498)-N(3))-methyltransferase [Legionellaceae bacterium]
MRTIRIYQEGTYLPGQTLTLSEAASQHVGLVLRMQPSEQLTLFRGDNHECLATILTVKKRQVMVQIDTNTEINRESPRSIHLAQAISKGDRMEWVIQKAVELGVSSIAPLVTSHCVVRLNVDRMTKKQAQWQAIAISACEQSGRNQIPVIHPTCSLDTYLQQCQARYKWVLYPDAGKSWRDYANLPGDMALLIGPEGGLSESEINQAMTKQFQPLCLGPRILRTETAAITAISVLQAVYGDI